MLVKGTAVRATLRAIVETEGDAGLATVRAALPPDVREVIDAGVLASTSYPVHVPAAIQEAIRTQLGRGLLAANRKVAAAAGRADFTGVYRVFVRAASFSILLRSMERAFRQYNSRGRVRWDRIATGAAEGTVHDVEGYNEPMWHAVAGRAEALLVLAGATEASVTIARWTPTDCDMRLRWR